ncbi:organic cation transporter protein-like [Bradysia coprophila]|uniref:organic cation transporter protein-like n=1 Tax=Bradysia coprophila TaxID=38358 RepID=UPI00187D8C49|nr:organic cation transporter protein-like [Bradysia coprophila]
MGYTKVEDVLQDLGGYSKYQKWLSLALIFPQFPTALIVLSPIFTGTSNVPLLCPTSSIRHNSTDACINALNCTDDSENFEFVSIVQEWNLVCSMSWVTDTITSFQMSGMMIGAFVSSIFSDTYGRKKCFIIQTFLMGLLGMAPALASGPWSYAVARFFAGFSVGATFVVYLSHLTEFLVPSWRNICGALSFYPIAEMVLPLLACLIGSWRLLTFATAIPALFLLAFYRFILESPRWLLVKNRPDEAHKVFEKIAEWNSKPVPRLDEIKELQSVILKQETAALSGLKAMKTIMKNQTLRRNLIIETFCVVTCAIVFYGVSFNAKNLGGNKYLNVFYMGVLDFVASPASMLFSNCMGRRKTFMIFMFSGTTFMIAIVFLLMLNPYGSSSPIIVIALSLGGRFFIVAGWSGLKVMILETSPTNLRATCIGLTVFAGYFGGVLSPQLATLATVSPALPYIILSSMTVLSSIFSWFLSEMLEKPLTDTMELDVRVADKNRDEQ